MNEELKKDDLLTVRPATDQDKAFIYSTWLKGLKYGNSWFNLIEDREYYEVYHAVIEAILNKPEVSILVCCLKDEPSVIIAYSVFEHNRLHWVHVKKAWRKVGIAKSIVPSKINTVSHLTSVGKTILLKKSLKFNPFKVI